MQANRRNLISVVVVAGLFLVVTIIGLVGNARAGNYVATPVLFTALGLAFVVIWLGHFRVRTMLRDKTPDRLIAHYHKTVRRVPHADAAIGYLCGLVAAFFGQFERAHQELDAVNWDATSPMYRGHHLYVLGVLAILEENDYPKALRLAAQARELEARDAAGGFELLDAVIRTVAGGVEPGEADAILEKMDKSARKSTGLIPGMCAWALAVYYQRQNMPDKATEYKEYLRLAVPHSLPMRNPA